MQGLYGVGGAGGGTQNERSGGGRPTGGAVGAFPGVGGMPFSAPSMNAAFLNSGAFGGQFGGDASALFAAGGPFAGGMLGGSSPFVSGAFPQVGSQMGAGARSGVGATPFPTTGGPAAMSHLSMLGGQSGLPYTGMPGQGGPQAGGMPRAGLEQGRGPTDGGMGGRGGVGAPGGFGGARSGGGDNRGGQRDSKPGGKDGGKGARNAGKGGAGGGGAGGKGGHDRGAGGAGGPRDGSKGGGGLGGVGGGAGAPAVGGGAGVRVPRPAGGRAAGAGPVPLINPGGVPAAVLPGQAGSMPAKGPRKEGGGDSGKGRGPQKGGAGKGGGKFGKGVGINFKGLSAWDFNFSWAKGKSKGQLMLMVDPAYKVWIGNLTEETKWKDLQNFLDQAGKTKWVEVFSGKGAGTGAAVYSEPEEVDKAVSTLNGKELNGNKIVIDSWAQSQQAS